MQDAKLMMMPTYEGGMLTIAPHIQQRVERDHGKILEYAALYKDGHDLGRLVVFENDEGFLLADGFHRIAAAYLAGLSELPCEVYPGTERDALLYATSCNKHGQPLTNADKRKRVRTLLTDAEWAQWSDNAIAKHCGVTHPFVGMVRKSLITVISEEPMPPSLVTVTSDNQQGSLHSEISEDGTSPTQRTYTNRYGQQRTMNTSAIGQQAPAPPPAVLAQEPEDGEVEETVPTTLEQTSTGDYEWYTPREVLALVRAVLGVIDVDPASCAAAQVNVQARISYTLADDGLRQPWPGKVFLNPPYAFPLVARFIGKLFAEIEAEHTTEAILLVNAATDTDWFQAAFQRADAVCFPDGRIHFVHATRGNNHPCRGQALLYYGGAARDFCAVCASVGVTTRVAVSQAASAQLALARREAAAEAAVPPASAVVSAVEGAEAPPRLRDQVGLQQAVLQTVQQLQPCTNAQVKAALREPRAVVHAVLQALVKKGQVVREGQTYRVVDAP
jgi:hypothetical protein